MTGTEAETVAGPATGTEPQTEQHPISSDVRTLFPGYFAMVMATGIIAVGASQQEIGWLADALYAIAAVTYPVLAVLLVWRPPGVPFVLALAAGLCGAATVAVTVAVSVPCHQRLAQGWDPAVHARLTRTNWWRTAAWTLGGVVALVMLGLAS